MKKQLIFIMTDTQRWDMVNCYRRTGLSTPCIDRLAASGVRYERAYTTQPVCGPARSGLFTGLYPSSNGSWANCMALGDNVHTIGQRLHDNGFATAYIGKWHLDGSDYFGNGICPDGWDPDYWYDMRRYLEELGNNHDRIKSRMPQSMDYEDIEPEFTYGWRVMQRALDYMEKHRDEDYFLVVSFDEPHGPSLCPQPYASMYEDYEFPKSPAVYDTLEGKPIHQKVWAAQKPKRDREKFKIKRKYFFGCNSYVDSLIGKVVDAAPSDAAIMYTSDHGDLLGSHCLFAKGPAAYDDVARIPFIVRMPGGLHGEVYSRQPVSHINVCPTVMEYFGLPIPKQFEGGSILRTAYDKDAPADPSFLIEFGRFELDHDHYGGYQLMRCLVKDNMKLVINLLSDDELYDLDVDPYECKNLIGDPAYRAVRNALHDELLDMMNKNRDPFRGYYWETRPWRDDAKEPTWKYTGWTRQRENEEYEPRQLDYATGLVITNAQREKIHAQEFPRFCHLDELINWVEKDAIK